MLCKYLTILGLMFSSSMACGQRKLVSVSLETGNAVSSMPLVGAPRLFYTNYHPFTTISTNLVWKEKRKHAWEQSFNVGYIYHRFIQHSIPIFSEVIYRHNFNPKFNLCSRLGIGYLHSIPDAERYKLNNQGQYERIKGIGRAQAMGKLSISLALRISSQLSATLNYGVIVQSPFIKSYVPLLPYNAIQLGLTKTIAK